MRGTLPQPISWQWLERQLVTAIGRARTNALRREHFLDLLDTAPSRTMQTRKRRAAKSIVRRSR